MARRVGEVYASEHELFDIGLASVELHAMGRSAARFGSDARSEAAGARGGAPSAATDHGNLLSLSLFLRAGAVGIALALAGLFELPAAMHPVVALTLIATGCALAWGAWRAVRAILARSAGAPRRLR
jgi:hypothetical protein